MARSKAGQSAEQLREQIRAAGLRATSPRIAVLQSLGRSRTPVSHAELAAELAPKGWDRATIYRNLIDLTNAGLVRRTDMGDHLWRFELREGTGEHATDEHPHFMCDTCGDVLCLPDESIEIKPARGAPRALRRKGLQIQIKGRCDRCGQP
ncbi:Fur family transcriptional regulator [Sorangium cellulosum]|nr:Fur family transcriptional regulator [Sorangium cellulosum]